MRRYRLLAVLSLSVLFSTQVQAKTFPCRAGDVPCLIAAITEANASGKKNDIRLEAGTYTLVDVNNLAHGPNGLPSIVGNLTITGVGADLTIIERNSNAAAFRLIEVAATGRLTLDGLTLGGGFFNVVGGGCGSGLYTAGGSVTLSHSAVVDNINWGHDNGGGLCVEGRATATITASTISGNFAVGIVNTDGGGLYIASGAAVSITASTIADNVAHDHGGGLYIASGAVVTIADTAIVGNGALFTGGVYNDGTLTIINSTVAQNVAGQGSYSALRSGGLARVLNSTFAENVVQGLASGVVLGGNVTLQNTIVAHNTTNSTSANQPWDCSSGLSLGNNLFADIDECFPFSQTTLLPSDLTGAPGLGAYAEDDAPGTGHYPLLPGSQAINAANPGACPKRDQLGEQRDKLCDIGAIEFQGKTVSSR